MSRSVITYRDDDNIFRPLIIMLNDFLKPGSPNLIPEILYLKQMSSTKCLPNDIFYPRAIITHILKRHEEIMKIVLVEPHFAKRFSCPYYDNDGRLRMHEFSNTMPLHADIVTLNFLYLFYRKHEFFPPEMFELATMMHFKYSIYEHVAYNEKSELDPRKITFRRILQSFQSVTLWMYNYMPEFNALVSGIFHNIPAMVGAPYFPLILSSWIGHTSSLVYLFTLNQALRAVLDHSSKEWICLHANRCATFTDVYTSDMRLDICIKLGIATNLNGMYVFASNFEKCYINDVIAKTLIRYGNRTFKLPMWLKH